MAISTMRLNPLTAELIYLALYIERVKPINRLTAVKGLNLIKNEIDEITIFAFLCIFGGLINLLW